MVSLATCLDRVVLIPESDVITLVDFLVAKCSDTNLKNLFSGKQMSDFVEVKSGSAVKTLKNWWKSKASDCFR